LYSSCVHQHAAEIIRTLTDPRLQVDALAEIATVLAQAGDQWRTADIATTAAEIARTIRGTDSQADALAKIVMALSMAGEASYAQCVAAAARAAGRWTIAVGPVLLLAPST
jgi:hypothetical protein